jgi:hypothetical protein
LRSIFYVGIFDDSTYAYVMQRKSKYFRTQGDTLTNFDRAVES